MNKKNIGKIDRPLKIELINNSNDDEEDENNYKKNNKNEADENNLIKNSKLIPKWYKLLNEFFNLKENFNELFDFNNSNINNVSGLNYIKGLFGISIIFTILGQTFLVLLNSPLKDFGVKHFYDLISDFLYVFIFIGLRYSPRVIFSCSGYMLSYKYLSYIDKENKNYFFKFFLPQLYKYLMFILILLFERYSFFYIVDFITHTGTAWKIYYEQILKKPTDKLEFFLNLFTIKSFYIQKDENKKIGNLFDYLWMPINEIVFFIIGTLIIFFGYKCKLRIDFLLIFLIILLYGGKISTIL